MIDNPIKSFHCHIYFDTTTRNKAISIQEKFISYKNFLSLKNQDLYIGKLYDTPIGPHTKPMFMIACSDKTFTTILSNLILHHDSLSVLIHPETGEDLADHTDRAIWLGDKVLLDLAKL